MCGISIVGRADFFYEILTMSFFECLQTSSCTVCRISILDQDGCLQRNVSNGQSLFTRTQIQQYKSGSPKFSRDRCNAISLDLYVREGVFPTTSHLLYPLGSPLFVKKSCRLLHSSVPAPLTCFALSKLTHGSPRVSKTKHK